MSELSELQTLMQEHIRYVHGWDGINFSDALIEKVKEKIDEKFNGQVFEKSEIKLSEIYTSAIDQAYSALKEGIN